MPSNRQKVEFFIDAFPSVDKDIVEMVCTALPDDMQIQAKLAAMAATSAPSAPAAPSAPTRSAKPSPSPPHISLDAKAATTTTTDTATASSRLGLILDGIQALGLLDDSEEEKKSRRADSATVLPAVAAPLDPPTSPPQDETECIICFEQQRQVLLLPCKHLCLCQGCSPGVNECPICRADIAEKMAIYVN